MPTYTEILEWLRTQPPETIEKMVRELHDTWDLTHWSP